VRKDSVAPPRQDSVAVLPVVKAPADLAAFFKDTSLASNGLADRRLREFRTPAQRDSLRAVLRSERELWRARAPQDYRFLLRAACFCPGQRGWLLMEVRGRTLRAWDRTGKPASLSDWGTFSVEDLFTTLEQTADRDGSVQIGFDPIWHFPAYVHTAALPGPDMWATYEARGLRPI
jgi:hypothetical protein